MAVRRFAAFSFVPGFLRQWMIQLLVATTIGLIPTSAFLCKRKMQGSLPYAQDALGDAANGKEDVGLKIASEVKTCGSGGGTHG